MGLLRNRDYDIFTTHEPSSGQGNGLGSAMPLALLETSPTPSSTAVATSVGSPSATAISKPTGRTTWPS